MPDETITRAQFVTMLLRVLELPEETYNGRFDDVFPNDWYAGYIQAARSKNIVSENSGDFRPNAEITREEVAKMIISGYTAATGEQLTLGSIEAFEDKDQISEEAAESVGIAAMSGLMYGIAPQYFAPKNSCTRANAAVILKGLYDYIEKTGRINLKGSIDAQASTQDIYFLDFERGTINDGVYNDGTTNCIKFSGDISNLSLEDGQLVVGELSVSTVGVFDYGFMQNPQKKYKNFEISYDLTILRTSQDRHLGFQFGKNGWADGWDSRLKFLTTFDEKMNFYDGTTSIANVNGTKFNRLSDFSAEETFRVRYIVNGNHVSVFYNYRKPYFKKNVFSKTGF